MHRFVWLSGLMLIAAPATAQTTLGLKGGVGFATIAIEEAAVEEKYVSGIVAGVEIGVPVSGVLSLRLGGSYAQKGGGGSVGGGTVTLNIDYFHFSALARVATSGDGLSVGLAAGPWAAYRRSCELEGVTLEGTSIVTPCYDPPLSDFDIKTLDFGLAVGGVVEFPVSGRLRLGLDALYSLGLASVDDDDSKTRHLTVQTGLSFPVG